VKLKSFSYKKLISFLEEEGKKSFVAIWILCHKHNKVLLNPFSDSEKGMKTYEKTILQKMFCKKQQKMFSIILVQS
jgi:hypothetical protein